MSYYYEHCFPGWPAEVPQLDDTCDHRNSYFFQLFSIFVIEAEVRAISEAKKGKDTKKGSLQIGNSGNIYGHMKRARAIVDLT